MLAVFTVSNLDDFAVSNPGEAPGTLRQAIFDANDTPGFDTIEFAIELSGTIFLAAGQLHIFDSVSVSGPGAAIITIDGQNASRLFDVNDFDGGSLLDVHITGLALTGGNEVNGGGAIANQEQLEVASCLITGNTAQWGGGVYNGEYGDLTVSHCEVSGNTATSSGGGIYNWGGTASVADSGIIGNESSTTGGGVLNANNGSMTITRSTISGNKAVTTGGGLHNGDGNITIADSTISGNEADYGGGVYVVTPSDDTTTITGSTISNNIANQGGAGVYNENGHVVIECSTITENNSNDFAGSGIVSRGDGFTVLTEIQSSIIAGNHHTDMAVAGFPNTFVSQGYNLVGVFGFESELDPTDIVIGPADPLLGPLANNGGPTLTHVPLLGSPALDAGDPLAVPGVGGVPDFDQRGFGRVFDGDNDTFATIDIGAVESDLVYFVVDTLDDHSNGDFSTGDFTLREAIEQASLVVTGSPVITFDPTLYSGGPATIVLDVFQQLEITDSMVIQGPGSDLLTIQVQNIGRVFLVDDFDSESLVEVAIRDLTITGAGEPNGGGGIYNRERLEVANSLITGNTAQWGGGIYNDVTGELTVANSEISGNDTTSSGGGIYNWGGTVFIFDSTVSGNEAYNQGGGIKNVNNGAMTISRSTISGNVAQSSGGGLYNGDGNVTIADSTFSGNASTTWGGGVYVLTPTDDTTTVTNSTISNNTAPLGGAGLINFSGRTVIQFSTVTENNSNDFAGSGVVTWGDSAAALTEIYSTIVAGNHHTDVAVTGGFVDTFESLGYNVIGTGSVDAFDDPGDWVIEAADPGLGPLADNGGPTMTHALLPGSPAIDQGDSSLVAGQGDVPLFDQRFVGFDRIRDGNGDSSAVIDVGAFELDDVPDSADFDQDGDVDGRDFLAWQRGYGTLGPSKEDGDADNDGNVDGVDLGIWQDQYGTTPPWVAASVVSVVSEIRSLAVSAESGSEPNTDWAAAVDAAILFDMINSGEPDRENSVYEDEWIRAVPEQTAVVDVPLSTIEILDENQVVESDREVLSSGSATGMEEILEPLLK